MLSKLKKLRGFTLIELIIVIAIIAVLAAIAVPAFGQIRQKANVSADIGNARSIYSVVVAGIADESITVPAADASPVWEKLSSVGGEDLTDHELAGIADPKAYQGTSFYVKIDNNGNVEIGVGASVDDKTAAPQSMTANIYPTPSGRYINPSAK